MAYGAHATVENVKETVGSHSTVTVEPYGPGVWMPNDLTVAVTSAFHPKAMHNFVFAGAHPRSIPGLQRLADAGGVESYTATCARTGGNHTSILHHSLTNMVECTAADTTLWIVQNAALPHAQ